MKLHFWNALDPIKTSEYRDDVLKYCQVKYAPFNKDGNGNMGYLYDIDPKLASVFLKASANKNADLGNLNYIQWLIG